MAKLPTMPVQTDALFADTTHLSPSEFGAYCRLLFAMWRNGAWLPADDRQLRKFSTLDGRAWARSRETILEFFEVDEDAGIVTQGKLSAMWRHALERSDKASDAALDSWKARGKRASKRIPKHGRDPVSRDSVATHSHDTTSERDKSLKSHDQDDADAMRTHMQTLCSGDAIHDPLREDDDDPRARARDDDDIPFDQVDDDDTLLTEIARSTGIDIGRERDPKGRLRRWKALDLDRPAILEEVRAVMRRKGNGRGPPKSLAYFDSAMHALADSKMQPDKSDRQKGKDHDRKQRRDTKREQRARDDLSDDIEFARSLDRQRSGSSGGGGGGADDG